MQNEEHQTGSGGSGPERAPDTTPMPPLLHIGMQDSEGQMVPEEALTPTLPLGKASLDHRPTILLADRMPAAASAGRRLSGLRRPRNLIALALVAVLLALTIPTSLAAYSTYAHAKALALDGVRHLEAVKAKLPTSSNNLSALLDSKTLAGLQPDIQAAQSDFAQLNDLLNHSQFVAIAGSLPSLSAKVTAARHLVHIGTDLCQLAEAVISAATTVGAILHRSPLSTTVPFLTQADLTQFTATLNTITPLVNDITTQTQGVNLGALLSASQSVLLNKLISDLPQIQGALTTVRQFIAIAPAVLGLKSPITYLVVTMDRSELRPTGGFQGNYALAQVSDGRLTSNIQLTDTYLLDEKNGVCWNASSSVPAAYQSWWPWSCWGLRDANISADFPTTARTSLQLLHTEGGPAVQGMIALTLHPIQQILDLTGPVYIGLGYNVTVTGANLEATIHKFQLTHANPGTDLPPPDQLSSPRKRFTALLGRALQDRLHKLPQTMLLQLAREALDDLKNKDIEVYAADPSVEQFFSAHQVDASMVRGPNDSLFAVDTNLSGKQNTYVQEHIADTIQLDSSGTATHTATISYDFVNPGDAPTYGYYPGYKTYLRVYVPPQSVFLSSSASAISHVASDEAQRAMWAGFVYVPQNGGPVTITLRWRVPNAVSPGQPYHFTIQNQAGNHITIAVSITPAGAPKPALNYTTPAKQIFERDQTFTVTP